MCLLMGVAEPTQLALANWLTATIVVEYYHTWPLVDFEINNVYWIMHGDLCHLELDSFKMPRRFSYGNYHGVGKY